MNDEREGTYGGFWIRALGILADSAILFVVSMVVLAVFSFLGPTAAVAGAVLVFLVYFLYFPLMHASERQATFGKQMLGLKVTHAVTGERITLLRAIGRELGKIVSGAVFCIGYIIAGFTRRKQALHDLIASTTVIRDGEAHVGRAVVVSVVGFVIPMVAAPMILGAAFLGALGGMAAGEMGPSPGASPRTAPSSPAALTPARVATTPAPVKAAVVPPTPAATSGPAPSPPSPPSTQEMAGKPEAAPAATAVSVTPALAALAPAPSMPSPIGAKQGAMKSQDDRPAGDKGPARAGPATTEVEAKKIPEVITPWSGVSSQFAFTPKHNDLVTAVIRGDHAAVEEMLAHGWWPDKPDSHGRTPLKLAAERGDLEMVALLKKHGAR